MSQEPNQNKPESDFQDEAIDSVLDSVDDSDDQSPEQIVDLLEQQLSDLKERELRPRRSSKTFASEYCGYEQQIKYASAG